MTGRWILALILVAMTSLGLAPSRAQIVVGDPLNASKTFASYCSACHKTASGLAKGAAPSSLASFLRQHYTTGPEMSGAMAAFLVTAGNDPRAKQRTAGDKGGQEKDKKGSSSRQQTAAKDDQGARRQPAEGSSSIIAPEKPLPQRQTRTARTAEPRPAPITDRPQVETPPPVDPQPSETAPAAPPSESHPDYWESSP